MALKKALFNGFSLAPLESDVLDVIWPDKMLKVRQVYSILRKKRKVALTSIAVILDRLYKKGIVNREMEAGRGGFRYLYFPVKDKSEYERTAVDNAVNLLIDKFGKSALTYFNERFNRRK